MIPIRKLGSSGLFASAQGLGCMGMTAFYDLGTDDRETSENISLKAIEVAVSKGITLLDTAFIYQNVDAKSGKRYFNEDIVGKAVKKFGRDKFIICTKTGVEFGPKGATANSSEALIRHQIEESLARLGTHIDLYYLHRIDSKIPIEETMQVLVSLIKAGKIKYIGLSECTVQELRRAHSVHPITAIQMEWSLFTRDIEVEIVPTARELGVGIVAYSPLGRGFLSAKFDNPLELDEKDFRRNMPRFTGENFVENDKGRKLFFAIAQRKGCSPAQLALAWLHHQGDDVFPIPGSKNPDRVAENCGALSVKLTKEELEEIVNAIPTPKGDRYLSMASTYNARANF